MTFLLPVVCRRPRHQCETLHWPCFVECEVVEIILALTQHDATDVTVEGFSTRIRTYKFIPESGGLIIACCIDASCGEIQLRLMLNFHR